MRRQITAVFSKFPEILKKPIKPMNFGTAGYRDSSEELLNVVCRASLMAYIRSSTFCGKTIGIMITASHNKNTDNGIKMIDHNGDYFDKALELFCDEIVNCEDKDLMKILSRIHRKMGNMRDFGEGPIPTVAIGRDTRISGVLFENKIKETLELFGAKVVLYEVVTTPQMHYLIRNCNIEGQNIDKSQYYEHLVKNYNEIIKYTNNAQSKIYVDCANGVGGIAINELIKRLPKKEIKIINQGDDSSTDAEYVPNHNLLNHKCGADYILTNMKLPENITLAADLLTRCVSFDGDADRIIYFSTNAGLTVLDGDRIAVFFANYIYELIKPSKSLTIGIVLSHYSNSAAMKSFAGSIKLSIANTGVKNFVALSREYDVGVFFEPNGHGSVTFSTNFIRFVEESLEKYEPESQLYKNAKILKALTRIFDQSVGDAIANFLVIEALSTENTYNEILNLYEKLPTRLMSVRICDKTKLEMVNDIDLNEPKELREKIKLLCSKYKGRSFIRPSGTEDVVRIFSEANKKEDCDALCLNVAQAVYDICGGVGYHPEIYY